MNCLELIKDREREIECSITVPHRGRITASSDFVRQLIAEQRALGEEAGHDGSGVYCVGNLEIKADATLPKNTFMIELEIL